MLVSVFGQLIDPVSGIEALETIEDFSDGLAMNGRRCPLRSSPTNCVAAGVLLRIRSISAASTSGRRGHNWIYVGSAGLLLTAGAPLGFTQRWTSLEGRCHPYRRRDRPPRRLSPRWNFVAGPRTTACAMPPTRSCGSCRTMQRCSTCRSRWPAACFTLCPDA